MVRFSTERRGFGTSFFPSLLSGAALVALCAIGSTASAQQAPAPPDKGTPAAARGPQVGRAPGSNDAQAQHTPGESPATLAELMDRMKDHAKVLGGAITAKNSEAALGAVGEMEWLTIQAKKFPPANIEQIPEADRLMHTIAYRKSLLVMLRLLVDVEMLILEGKFDDALATLKGPVMEARDAAHDKFQPQKDRGPRDGNAPEQGGQKPKRN